MIVIFDKTGLFRKERFDPLFIKTTVQSVLFMKSVFLTYENSDGESSIFPIKRLEEYGILS